tara:strand:+ start:724 stop:927 length:204 start_codon:yes stop_codon:yes gene_type:complete
MDIEERLERIEKKLGIEDKREPVWFCEMMKGERLSFYKMTEDDLKQFPYRDRKIFDRNRHPLIGIVE